MKLEYYNHKEHYRIINRWYNKYFDKNLHKSYLPIHGLVAIIDDYPVAACWLIQTDMLICFTDLWVSDPEASKEDRDNAINFLIGELGVLAKKLGYVRINCDITIPKLKRRAEKNGYVKIKNTEIYSKAL